jgi:hypothetical protein
MDAPWALLSLTKNPCVSEAHRKDGLRARAFSHLDTIYRKKGLSLNRHRYARARRRIDDERGVDQYEQNEYEWYGDENTAESLLDHNLPLLGIIDFAEAMA